jgi:hypothetical protein
MAQPTMMVSVATASSVYSPGFGKACMHDSPFLDDAVHLFYDVR